MPDVVYYAPTGARTVNPTEEFLRDVVLNAPAETWRVGTGESNLERPDAEESLMFFAVEPFGMYVAFVPPADAEVVAVLTPDMNEVVEHDLSGLQFVRPRACFLPRPLAWEVVREFALHGRRLGTLRWVCIGDLDYHDPYWSVDDEDEGDQ